MRHLLRASPDRLRTVLAIAACCAATPAWSADDTLTLEALTARLRQLEARLGQGEPAAASDAAGELAALDQRLRILERTLEIQREDSVALAAKTPVVAVNDKGLSARSPDSQYDIKLRGTAQADARFFLDDDAAPQNDTFLWRRIRPSLEGSLGPLVAFRLTPEFAGDGTTIVDAYVDVKFDPAATLRVGKVKGPIGLERLQSASGIAFVERGFPTELAPNRDIGAQLQGDLAKASVNYTVGVYNGAPDGRDSSTTNPDDDFELAARVFFEPFKNAANAWSGLGFGMAASSGDKRGSGNNVLPRYRTPGQLQFFNYRGAVLADGKHTRWSPQAYYYRNAFGLLAEYIESEQELLLPGDGDGGGTRAELANSAWQLAGSWVLTGEDASFRGVVKPDNPFGFGDGGWGAFEVAARYGELDIDTAAFPVFADPATAAARAASWGLGLNWYPSSNLKLVLNHTRTRFDGGAADGADRDDEKTVFTRVQVAF
ncbi:OprO/OprP family phosphate-selective porin [Chiayiivirga flava]|uniref:Phosphate-selective porin OprO/OprP n=1 Tax=Chiayiivirga flava TaxID=659595 RepID=A0A7W8D5V4_9GAMM|nr:porin [Chiayiivirga flava]MBB5207360.1 phosphate-selective porin OprO/OprP [Chiayiivirga flava]